MSAPLVRWICSELSKLLGFDAPEDIAKYILAIDNEKDLEEYLYDLLDTTKPRNARFVEELRKKWKPHRAVDIPENVQIYKKPSEESEFVVSPPQGKGARKKVRKNLQSQDDDVFNDSAEERREQRGKQPSPRSEVSPGDSKKKSRFVPLFSEDGEARAVAKLPGRHACDCQAAKHPLINNCMKCGRIVCEQEGAGPCLFCKSLVCTPEQQEILNRGSKKSEKLRQILLSRDTNGAALGGTMSDEASQKMKAGYEKAMAHKNRLLEFDKTSVKRTQVIDDESDYFSTDSNRWLSKEEREKLKHREDELRSVRHASRKDRKVTLDFAGRRVVEEKESLGVYDRNDTVVQEVHYGKKDTSKNTEPPDFKDDDFVDLVNPLITQEPPQFVDVNPISRKSKAKKPSSKEEVKMNPKVSRLQDKELQEMSDEGVCLSMHQPWATLLTRGIKRDEGRTWYSAHRGRLWIAATTKQPTVEEIAMVENMHRQFHRDPVDFPKDYPTGCLLGCVDVLDVLDQDSYREEYPDGESESPYVFVCRNPQELLVKFPMKGKHKIYKLDHHIHQGAKKGLRPSPCA